MPYLVPIESNQRTWVDAAFVDFGCVQSEIVFVFCQKQLGIGLVHTLGSRGIFLFRPLLHHGSNEKAKKTEMDG